MDKKRALYAATLVLVVIGFFMIFSGNLTGQGILDDLFDSFDSDEAAADFLDIFPEGGNGLPDAWELRYASVDTEHPYCELFDGSKEGLVKLCGCTANCVVPFETASTPSDSDGDGLTNRDEFELGTDPTRADTDGDNMPDGWEVEYSECMSPFNPYDAARDFDGDGFDSYAEYIVNDYDIVYIMRNCRGVAELDYGVYEFIDIAENRRDEHIIGSGRTNEEFKLYLELNALGFDAGSVVSSGQTVLEWGNPCGGGSILDKIDQYKIVKDASTYQLKWSDHTPSGLYDFDGDGVPNSIELKTEYDCLSPFKAERIFMRDDIVYEYLDGEGSELDTFVFNEQLALDFEDLLNVLKTDAATYHHNHTWWDREWHGGHEYEIEYHCTYDFTQFYEKDNDLYAEIISTSDCEYDVETDVKIAASAPCDSDRDGLPNWWGQLATECVTPMAGDNMLATGDRDRDGLSNLEEYELGTNPCIKDSDGDSISDNFEKILGLNPHVRNIDGDYDYIADNLDTQVDNAAELGDLGFTNADANDNEIPDGWEIAYGLLDVEGRGVVNEDGDDISIDYDVDNLLSVREYHLMTDPTNPDSDDDGLYDGWEVEYGFDPITITDGDHDTDGDGLTDLDEFKVSISEACKAAGLVLSPLDKEDFRTFLEENGEEIGSTSECMIGGKQLNNFDDNDDVEDWWEIKYYGSEDFLESETFYGQAAEAYYEGAYWNVQHILEYLSDSNAGVVDTDNDGLFDDEEYYILMDCDKELSPLKADYGMWVLEEGEKMNSTCSGYYDWNNDTLPDWWEIKYFLLDGETNVRLATNEGTWDGIADTDEHSVRVEYRAIAECDNLEMDPMVEYDDNYVAYMESFTYNTEEEVCTILQDADDDKIPDWWEIKYFKDGPGGGDTFLDYYQGKTALLETDTDGDGLMDAVEYDYKLHPGTKHTDDGDTYDDYYEWKYAGKKVIDALGVTPAEEQVNSVDASCLVNPSSEDKSDSDYDGDDVPLSDEYKYKLNPCAGDSDNDSLPDKWEVDFYKMMFPEGPSAEWGAKAKEVVGSAVRKATGEAGAEHAMDEVDVDFIPGHDWTPPEGLLNASKDYDSDGLTTYEEFLAGTHPGVADTDGDGLPDKWEITYTSDASTLNICGMYLGELCICTESLMDGTCLDAAARDDSLLDPDGDGLTNLEEFNHVPKYNPVNPMTPPIVAITATPSSGVEPLAVKVAIDKNYTAPMHTDLKASKFIIVFSYDFNETLSVDETTLPLVESAATSNNSETLSALGSVMHTYGAGNHTILALAATAPQNDVPKKWLSLSYTTIEVVPKAKVNVSWFECNGTAPAPGTWSECKDNKRTRTEYSCDHTDGMWKPYTKTESCGTIVTDGLGAWWILIIAGGVIVLVGGFFALWYFYLGPKDVLLGDLYDSWFGGTRVAKPASSNESAEEKLKEYGKKKV